MWLVLYAKNQALLMGGMIDLTRILIDLDRDFALRSGRCRTHAKFSQSAHASRSLCGATVGDIGQNGTAVGPSGNVWASLRLNIQRRMIDCSSSQHKESRIWRRNRYLI